MKTKNKKNHGTADKLHAKKSQNKFKKQQNPFEVHINKEKFKILGKKSKNDRGLPGVSRAKAMKKRKNTLGYEMKIMNKTNTFLDKRIGEKNYKLSEEDKIMARFAAERIQQHKSKSNKQSIYNLADDEILTHRGQTLEEIEKFDDPRSDDDDEEEFNAKKTGHLEGDFVADANFGGGILSRSDKLDGAKSRKDLIEQLIIESKKRKIEKQKLKEETLDLTEKLDTEWKDLQVVVSRNFNKEAEKLDEPPSLIDKLLSAHDKKNEEYDKTMRELKFEPRGTPSDRLKSEDEIAKSEKDKLEQLERDRLSRMHGTAEINKSKTKPKHRSADDLDDGYAVDSDPEMMVAYDSEGKLLTPLEININKDKTKEDSENEDTMDGDENSDDEEGDDSDNSEDSLNDLRELNDSSEDDDEDDNDKDDKAEEIVKPINKTPIKKNDDESEKNDSQKKRVSFALDGQTVKRTSNVEPKGSLISCIKKRKLSDSENKNIVAEVKNNVPDLDKIKVDLQARKEMMEKAAKELPFTYEMPNDYDALADLFENQPPEYVQIIIERIIKCNHPSLLEGNKQKLGTLFAFLLQYLNDLFTDDNIENEDHLIVCFKYFDRLVGHFYNLAQMDPDNAKNCIIEVIQEKFEEYKIQPKKFPAMDTIMFFKLVSILFSTSDLKHPVVTPCFYFMSQILATCRIKSNIDITRGLFIITILLEYTSLSKRFLPSAINFIRGILALYLPPSAKSTIKVIPPFKSNASMNIKETRVPLTVANKNMPIKYLIDEVDDYEFQMRTLYTTTKLFEALFNLSNDLHIQKTLFDPHFTILCNLQLSTYPQFVSNDVNKIIANIQERFKEKALKPLVEENKKPKVLRQYEPAVENEFSGKKKRIMSKEKSEHQRLLYKHKKEMKGALREIRRDKSYISSVKIKERIKSDNIRKEKVKQIYSEASLQQGELNALQRSKKKKK